MPINAVLPSNGTGLSWGPGLRFSGTTDIIGPIQIDSQWVIKVGLNVEATGLCFQFTKRTNGEKSFLIEPWVTDTPIVLPNFTPTAGQTVHIVTELQSPTGAVLESDAQTAIWDTTVGLPTVIGDQVQGGFTATDRTQLQETHTATQLLGNPADLVVDTPSGLKTFTLAELFSRTTLDKLTLQEVTSGPTCEPVRASFSFFYYGVIVRVTTIDENLTPKTPDEQWYFPDLAVLRIFRGADLQYRRGIHTPTFLTEQAWEFGWNIRNVLDMLGVPPDNTLAVDWRAGCCGQVFLLKWP